MADEVLGYAMNLRALYCVRTTGKNPTEDFEVLFFEIPQNAQKIVVRYRPRIGGELGPESEFRVMVEPK